AERRPVRRGGRAGGDPSPSWGPGGGAPRRASPLPSGRRPVRARHRLGIVGEAAPLVPAGRDGHRGQLQRPERRRGRAGADAARPGGSRRPAAAGALGGVGRERHRPQDHGPRPRGGDAQGAPARRFVGRRHRPGGAQRGVRGAVDRRDARAGTVGGHHQRERGRHHARPSARLLRGAHPYDAGARDTPPHGRRGADTLRPGHAMRGRGARRSDGDRTAAGRGGRSRDASHGRNGVGGRVKRVPIITAEEAAALVQDGDTLLVGGFGMTGNPVHLTHALAKTGTRNLTYVANNVGEAGLGGGRLLRNGQISKAIGSFFTSNPEAVAAAQSGAIAFQLLPQGTLAEALRAGGAGIGGFFTPTGANTDITRGHETRDIGGVPHVFVPGIRGDVAFVRAWT